PHPARGASCLEPATIPDPSLASVGRDRVQSDYSSSPRSCPPTRPTMPRPSLPCFLLTTIFALNIAVPASAQPAPGLNVPPGFEVTEYADSNLANDIYTMTVDPKGRIVVAGRGYIRVLVDSTGKGRADKAISFADTPKDGAMGLLWEGD